MVGWRRGLAVCIGAVVLLWGLEAAAECRTNDCRRVGISFGGRQFVFGNAAGDPRTFFFANFELGLGGRYVAFEADTAISKELQLVTPALLLRVPIDLGKTDEFQLEPTLGIGPSFWFWKEGNRKVNGMSLRLSPRLRLIWNLNRSFAMSLDVIWAEALPLHYSFDTKNAEGKARTSDHAWVWMSFGVGIYHRF
ncbi:MAG: hypothetical protein HY906_21195 [Deltaproteobacteria bacterium]|nr:hypothetical protein [Deltaproteobacteria bacterium]